MSMQSSVPQWPLWQVRPEQQSLSLWQMPRSSLQLQNPALQWRCAQQSASLEQAPCTTSSGGTSGSRLETQLEHFPPLQVPAQQPMVDVQVELGPPQGRQWPPVQDKPSQHSLLLLHWKSSGLHNSRQVPERHWFPEQQKGPTLSPPHA